MIKGIINTSLTDRFLVLIATFFEPRRQCVYPIFAMLLSPMIAALAMSNSSMSVIRNALRLRGVKL